MWQLGGQRVGIVSQTPVLDGDGNPQLSALREPLTEDAVVWVDNSSFEQLYITTPRTFEHQTGPTETTSSPAWVFFPVRPDGTVIGVDDSGTKRVITGIAAKQVILYDGVDYQVRADGFVEYDLQGRPSYMFCMCEYQAG